MFVAECQAKKWAECLQSLDRAAEADPDGEGDPSVVEMRSDARMHLHLGDEKPMYRRP